MTSSNTTNDIAGNDDDDNYDDETAPTAMEEGTEGHVDPRGAVGEFSQVNGPGGGRTRCDAGDRGRPRRRRGKFEGGYSPPPTTSSLRHQRVEGDVPTLYLYNNFFVEGVRIGWPFPEVMKPQMQIGLYFWDLNFLQSHLIEE